MELNGWSSPQMLRRYGTSARNARARRTCDRTWPALPANQNLGAPRSASYSHAEMTALSEAHAYAFNCILTLV